MRNYFLKTERILFSEWTANDTDLAKALWGNPEVTKLICASGVFTEEDIARRLYALSVKHSSVTVIPMKLTAWMNLTDVPYDTRNKIRSATITDINGGEETRLEPYMVNGEIMFDHKWLLFIAQKSDK